MDERPPIWRQQKLKPQAVECESGAVRELLDIGGDYWTAIGGSDGLYCYCLHTENIRHFE